MDLPVIVSGPILRRVDQQNVYIWIATSQPLQIKAKLFRIHEEKLEEPPEYSLVSDQSETKNICFGDRLYIHLIKVTPVSGFFPAGILLGYNLFFTSGERTVDLGHFGLLAPGDDSLVYGNLPYPSFFIQERKHTKVLYGSCRKLHGEGEDALAAGDMLMEETFHTALNRPQSLFLLGDQIYADDVADPLFPLITSLGKQLVGKKECLSKVDKRLEHPFLRRSVRQIRGRKFIMEQLCQFTSAHSHNHAMQFSEYAALYLFSWGPQLWEYIQEKGGLPVFEEEAARGKIHFVFPPKSRFQKEHKAERKQREARFLEESEKLRQSIAVLRRVRRLLANIPVYMIFDDHDITDDWNISREWKEKVEMSPLGRHVTANGLGAYWAFQAWGNDPESFNEDFIKKIQQYASTFDVTSSAYQEWLHCLGNRHSWHFVAPTEPKAVFLDTRTKRVYDLAPKPVKIGRLINETIQSPQLISQEAWLAVSASLFKSGWKKGEELIVASPAPLYGLGLIESALHSYVYPLRAFGLPVHQLFDLEAWKYNGKGFGTFLYWIFEWQPRHCFIVSGDVHYASSVKSTVQSWQGRTANIIQFTSSPTHNGSFSGVWGCLIKYVSLLKSWKRKKKEIIRFCDGTYTIFCQKGLDTSPNSYYWKEKICYLPTKKGTIIETKNNLGVLTFSSSFVQNSLVAYKAFEKKETLFEEIKLL